MLRLVMHTAMTGFLIAVVTTAPLLMPIVARWMIDRHVDRWVRIHLSPEQTKGRI